MSITKRFLESEEERNLLKEQALALVESGTLDGGGAAEGIARKLADTGRLDGLTSAQRAVYDRYIEPHFHIRCSNPDCGSEIEDYLVASAIQDDPDSALCGQCLHLKEQMMKD